MRRGCAAVCCIVLAQLGVVLGVLVGVTDAATSGAATSRTEILDFGYAPGQIVIVPGNTVVWSNNGASTHSVSPDGGSEPFGSGKLPPGRSHLYTFPNLGTYAYHCDIYPSMRGVVRVVDPASTTTTTSGPARAPFGSATAPPSTVRVIPRPPPTASPDTTAPAGVGSAPTAPAPKPRVSGAPAAGTAPVPPRSTSADFSALLPSPHQQQAASQPSPPSPGAVGASEEWAGESRDHRNTQNGTLALIGKVLFAAGAVVLLSGMRLRRR